MNMSRSNNASQPVTARCGVEGLSHLKSFYPIPDFRIGGTYDLDDPSSWESGGTDGVTLESLGEAPLRTACITAGTPHRDADGYIDNAVLFSPFYSGDACLMYFYWHRGQGGNDFCGGPVVGPGELIDTERHYVIFLDALGLWGAGKPSDGLGLKFPQYSIQDCVQANYRLLRDHLKVSRVKLATGASMGAIQSYLWALMHPGFVEAIMPMGGVTETDASLRWLFRLMSAAIESDPAWRDTAGDYYHLPKDSHPYRGVMFGWSILFHSAMSFDYRIQAGWDEVQKEAFAWDLRGKEGALLVPYGRNYDAVDLLYRNRAGESFNVTGQLHRIRARTLILHVANDHWVRLCMARKAQERIAGSRLCSFEHPLGHYALFRAPNVFRDTIRPFLEGASTTGTEGPS
jgi:homoserine acetyltransferase